MTRVDSPERCPNTAENAAALRLPESIDREVTMTTSRRSLLRNSAATVAAVGLGSTLVRAQEPPIRIGVIYDLSGPFAAAGSVPCAIGAQIAIDIVNERGGVAGKYKVQPINADRKARRMPRSTRSNG
jgi:ABC-type branched-subunit amino acid transport system substrate-binding protein